MTFVLLVCADVRGEKLNLEFPFEARPSIPDLAELIERVFRFETSNAVQTSPAQRDDVNEPIFTIAKLQVYVDEMRQWSELTSPSQLHMYDQVYVIRKFVHSDTARRELPRPRTSAYFGGRPAAVSSSQQQIAVVSNHQTRKSSPHDQQPSLRDGSLSSPANVIMTPRGGVSGSGGVSARRAVSGSVAAYDDGYASQTRATQSAAISVSVNQALLEGGASKPEMLRVVFEAADKRRHGVVTQYDLSSLLKTLTIHIEPTALEEMFQNFAQSGQGRGATDTVMSFQDFQNWAANYEATIHACFQRIVSLEKEHRIADAQRDSAVKITQLTRQRQELEDTLRRLDQDMSREHERKRSLEDEMDELLHERQIDISEDQLLVDKEVRVQHHRYLLKQEEDDFAALTVRRKRFDPQQAQQPGRSYSSQSTPGRTASGNYAGR